MALDPRTADQARTRLDAHLDAHPDSAWAELLYAMSYHVQGRYGPAKPHFERAIRLEPRLSATYHFYGYCLYYLGDAERARAAFEMHLHFLPREGNSHFGIGLIDLDEDRIDDAERRFRLAIEYQAGNPRRIKDVAAAHARLSDVDVRRGNLDDALGELDTAVALYPDLYGAHLKRYQVLVRLGRDDDADRAYDAYEAALARVRPELSTGGAAPSTGDARP
jgi:tetratricopeptide (TPR) repeat protein